MLMERVSMATIQFKVYLLTVIKFSLSFTEEILG
jgi:hypothetical protein